MAPRLRAWAPMRWRGVRRGVFDRVETEAEKEGVETEREDVVERDLRREEAGVGRPLEIRALGARMPVLEDVGGSCGVWAGVGRLCDSDLR